VVNARSKIEERASELRHLLNKAGHAYYVLDQPILEDAIYDNLYRELLIIEEEYPSLIEKDSPTQRLGGDPASGFQSVKHKIPLFSLDNAFNIDELSKWYERFKNILKNTEHSNINNEYSMVGELKIDGNALALTYENGVLTKALTRGNGTHGEDITANSKTIRSIPLKLQLEEMPPWVEVRGEAFIPNEVFENINKYRKAEGKSLFANPRNACAGSLRQLNPKIVASRKLDFFAYSVHLPNDWHINNRDLYPENQWDALNWLKAAGFKVNPNTLYLKTLLDVEKYYLKWSEARRKLAYETDGVVIKIDSFNLQSKAGFTQKSPRWAIALKYESEEAATKLRKLTYQVGRTGVITPVAEFKSISLAGTQVSRATLHNADRIKALDLHEEDTIIVRKAGEIIPEVVKVIKELRIRNPKRIELPKKCPICNSEVERINNQAATRCINSNCPAILKGALRHWVSKNAMDIEGLGEKLIDQLVVKEVVSSIADIYKLDTNEISSLSRMGIKSSEKLKEAIMKSKSKPWHKKLYALGIQHIGEANAKVLAENFNNMKEIENSINQEFDRVKTIYGIGEEINKSLLYWFKNEKNKILINKLESIGIIFEKDQNEIKDTNNNKFFIDKIFVITGSLETMSRSDAKEIIEKNGGKITSSVSKKTNYLIAGEKSGSKLEKAKELNIEIIDEKKFINIIGK
tara:strand:+ start:5890 stop:7962 length:2073 start_codon:yes stop_codon:yes gene_type:complete